MTGTYTFERPHRPWGVRIFNTLGAVLQTLGLPLGRLDEASLLEQARRRTGLSDFGDESFRAPLRVLLKAYREESELSPLGRLLTRVSTVSLLSNRLRMQQVLKEHPEIRQIRIERPLFIVAAPRTGTTLLYNLLAQDPAARALLLWEALQPVPLGDNADHGRDPRIRRAVTVIKILERLAPNLATVHPIEPTGPEECSRLQMNTFVSAYAMMEHYVPSYQTWLLRQPIEAMADAYEDYRQQLQVLQWQRPAPGHWVLKSPAHLYTMDALLRVFPDASVVQLHRDPRKVIPSLCSLFAVYQGVTSDQVRCQQLGAQVLELCLQGYHRSMRARQTARPGQILDLHYRDLTARPWEAIRQIYQHFDYPLSDAFEQQAQRWQQGHPKDRHGKHRYDLAQFGLSRTLVDQTFADYCQQFGVIPEEDEGLAPRCIRTS